MVYMINYNYVGLSIVIIINIALSENFQLNSEASQESDPTQQLFANTLEQKLSNNTTYMYTLHRPAIAYYRKCIFDDSHVDEVHIVTIACWLRDQ